jgi:hypothetical protein
VSHPWFFDITGSAHKVNGTYWYRTVGRYSTVPVLYSTVLKTIAATAPEGGRIIEVDNRIWRCAFDAFDSQSRASIPKIER